MNPADFFNAKVEHFFGYRGGYGDWTKSYWDLEFVTADINECSFSNFDEWGSKESRTCNVCGLENHTNREGSIWFCADATCQEVREYFGFTNGQRPQMANGKKGSKRDQRVSWMRKKLRDLYGVASIYYADELPIECRLPMLMSMMIAREEIENQRSKRDSDETNYFVACESEQREQAEDKATA